MATPSSNEVTELLLAWNSGEAAALEKLMPLVYDELRRLARSFMSGERQGHVLQTTALVNEAYLRLVDSSRVQWQNRAHFFAVSCQLMRRVLVDFARSRDYKKRGGGALQISLHDVMVGSTERPVDLIALDDALTSLAATDERASRVVELRFFGGLSIEAILDQRGRGPQVQSLRKYRLSALCARLDREGIRNGNSCGRKAIPVADAQD